MTAEPHPPHDPGAPHTPGTNFEARDAKIRPIAIFGAGLVALIVCSQLLLYGVYKVFIADRPPAPPRDSPASRAHPDIYQQLADLRASERATLGSYGWVDRDRGIVRVPIERALDLVAERGVPKGKGPKSEIELNSRESKKAGSE